MEKVLSIIIPTYNMENYLRKCLDSLIVSDGNMQRLEVLIINDGSKDSSSQIAHTYETKFPGTYRVIDKENGNYGSCINRGLKEATGKYIKVLDADDYFDTMVFDSYLSFLKEADVDMILTDYNEVSENGKLLRRNIIPYPQTKILKVADCCVDNCFLKLQMHAVTYRRLKLMENNYTQTTGVSYTDQEWVFMPITYMDSFCHFQGTLYQYLIGREGQTIDKTVSSKQYDVRCSLIYKRIDLFSKVMEERNLDENKLSFLKNRLLHGFYYMYRNALIFCECPEDQIKKFDHEIKVKSDYLYHEAAESDICKCKGIEFINYWRKHNTLPYMAKLLRIINRYAAFLP